MGKKVIVVGATGLIGNELVQLLAGESGVASVHTLTRRSVDYAVSSKSGQRSNPIINHVVDFARLDEFATLFDGDVLCSCLGTTVKQAGSIAAQRVVDLDYQLKAAQLAAQQGVAHYILVSSSGANSKSLSPYLKMKGELEDAVAALGFASTTILQPSLLLGERSETRVAEQLASHLLPALCKLPGLGRYRPIQGREVAQKIVELVHTPPNGLKRYTLDQVFPAAV